jgi:hypothetical protein
MRLARNLWLTCMLLDALTSCTSCVVLHCIERCLSLYLVDSTRMEILCYVPKSDWLFWPVLCSHLNFQRTIGFWLFKYFRIRELLALVLWMKIIILPLVLVISKLLRTCSFRERSSKESAGFWLLTWFVQFLRTMVIYQNWFFRTVVTHAN